MTTYNKNASHSFAFLPSISKGRNLFDRSHEYKTTFDSGYLIPIMVDDVLPGDTYTLKRLDFFIRLNTLITPVMDNAYLELFAFFVPDRLTWDHSKNFWGETDNPTDTTQYTRPQLTVPDGGFPVGSVADYFGLPTLKKYESIDAIPFRDLNLIFNEWFRDENLQNSLLVPKGDGPDDFSNYNLFRRGKRKDYFTSCLPWPQKGETVTLPTGVTAPVVGNGMTLGLCGTNKSGGFGRVALYCNNGSGGNIVVNNSGVNRSVHSYYSGLSTNGKDGVNFGVIEDPSYSGLIADLSTAQGATLSQFRHALQVQVYQEINARYGTRYTEFVRGQYGVISPDARLQRPELLGVSSTMLDINTVPQTSSTDTTSPQGNLSAYATFNSFNNDTLSFSKSFTEHGWIFILANVRADLTYQDGIDRKWSRKTPFDYAIPVLSNTSEQVVFNKEIFASGNTDLDNQAFGYQERYAEYRYYPSKITGKMRSSDPQSLDVWHLSQHFTETPKLNAQFIEDNPPFDRVIAVPSEPQFVGDFHFSLLCARPLPLFGIPSGLGVHL